MSDGSKLKRELRRTEILLIAREAFLRDGYAATSMSKISEIVGGSKRTLYKYFPSKKDLFFAVADTECKKQLDHIYDADNLPHDIYTAVATFCHRYLLSILSEDLIAFERMIIAESARFPEIGQAVYKFGIKRSVDRLVPFFEKGIEEGVLRNADAHIAAEFLLDLCTGHFHKLRLWSVIENIPPEQFEKQANTVALIFLAIFGTDELAWNARQSIPLLQK